LLLLGGLHFRFGGLLDGVRFDLLNGLPRDLLFERSSELSVSQSLGISLRVIALRLLLNLLVGNVLLLRSIESAQSPRVFSCSESPPCGAVSLGEDGVTDLGDWFVTLGRGEVLKSVHVFDGAGSRVAVLSDPHIKIKLHQLDFLALILALLLKLSLQGLHLRGDLCRSGLLHFSHLDAHGLGVACFRVYLLPVPHAGRFLALLQLQLVNVLLRCLFLGLLRPLLLVRLREPLPLFLLVQLLLFLFLFFGENLPTGLTFGRRGKF